MRYRLGFSSKLDNSSVYIECSVRKPGINHPVREIVKRFGKKKDLLAQDPLALEKIQKEVDELNSLYGSGETTGLGNQIYQWKGEQNTVLQVTAFSKNDEKATVILSVASFEYSVGS